MKNSRPYKRRMLNLKVNRRMQLQMIARITGILLFTLLISSLLFYWYADRQITSSFQLFHIKANNFLDFLLPMIIGSFVISLMVGTVASLFFPKRIAGGLYRIEKELEQVIKGDLTIRIVLRRGDDVTALATRLNQLIEGFRIRLASQRRALREAEQLCADSAGDPVERLAQVRKILENAGQELDELKLER